MVDSGVSRFRFALAFALAVCSPLACGAERASDDSASAGQAGTSGGGGGTAASAGQAGTLGYACPNAGPFVGGEAGQADTWMPTVPTSQCVVGESYCRMQTDNLRGLQSASCVSFTSSAALAGCAEDPSCACVCAHDGLCAPSVNCSCEDSDGFLRLICGEF